MKSHTYFKLLFFLALITILNVCIVGPAIADMVHGVPSCWAIAACPSGGAVHCTCTSPDESCSCGAGSGQVTCINSQSGIYANCDGDELELPGGGGAG